MRIARRLSRNRYVTLKHGGLDRLECTIKLKYMTNDNPIHPALTRRY